MMNADEIVALLDLHSTDRRVVEMLRNFGLDKYQPALDESDPEAVTDWFPVVEHGIEFGFKDEAYLRAWDPQRRRKADLIFHTVILYGDHPQMGTYRNRLPYGLSFGDDRQTVRSKIDRLGAPRRSYVRDVWDLPQHRLVVSYASDNTRIVDVVACLPDGPWPATEDDLGPFPSMRDIVPLFGKAPDDAEFVRTFYPFGVLYEAQQSETACKVDVREEFGFELHFDLATERHRPGSDRRRFKSITLYRDRDQDARGWRGDLPFGITMNDSPAAMFAKVPAEPVKKSERKMSGSALWELPPFSLHIVYSLLDNLVYRVTVGRPVSVH
jgi:hypothetical protein